MQFQISLAGAGFLTLLTLFLAPLWGGPIIAFFSEFMARMYKKTFMDKFAQQMTRLGLLSMTIFWVAAATLAVLTWQQNPAIREWILNRISLLAIIFGTGLAGTLLFTIYFLSWKSLKKKKPLHMTLAVLAVGCLKLLFWGPVAIGRLEFTSAWQAPFESLPAAGSPLWPLVVLWVPLSVALTAVLGLIYLVVRRNVDDFGRDYYKFTAAFCAKWCLALFFLVLPVLGWLSFALLPVLDLNDPIILFPGTLAGAGLLLVMINCLVISRSETPMRHKASMFFAVLLSGVFVLSSVYILGEGFSGIENSLVSGTDLKGWIEMGVRGLQQLQQ
jgi:hypothetical protein